MTLDLLPAFIREHYEVHEWKHACAILSQDFPNEWAEILDVLTRFRLKRSAVLAPGGGKSLVSQWIDGAFYEKGWVEKSFDTKIVVDGVEQESPTHSIDCYKNQVALEIEWNNKDPFFDRDLNNFRLLFELRAVSVGIIITKCDEILKLVKDLGRDSTGSSTTHMKKLLPRIKGGGGAGCPLLIFGISRRLYVED